MSSTADNAIGPVEMMLIGFPGNRFDGSIMPALGELTESGMVRLIDMIVVSKDGDGNVTAVELDDLDEDQAAAFDELDGEVAELFSDEDLLIAGERLEPNSTAALVLWENSWASKLNSAIGAAGGEVLMHDQIPAEIVAMAMDSQGAS
jgi:uncharacterized membrane protein